jgi:hypothetical protein
MVSVRNLHGGLLRSRPGYRGMARKRGEGEARDGPVHVRQTAIHADFYQSINQIR